MAIQSNFPAIRPSLNLDFANTKTLDSRITFTRASEGRFYDGKTFAKAEENLLLHSQAINQTNWPSSTIVTFSENTGETTAPDGTSTAEKVTANAGTGVQPRVIQAYTTTAQVTFSVFAKQGTHKFLQLASSDAASGFVNFDLDAGTFSATTATGSITSVGGGWFRCAATMPAASATSFQMFLAASAAATRLQAWNPVGTEALYLWGAQLEQRSAVTAYTPTTTQPITNYIPVLQTAAANVARFDHNPVTGESLGLLIEEQRTNLLTYSAEFDNAAWTKTRAGVTPNVVVAPDGALTADALIEDTTASNTHLVTFATVTGATNIAYTFSVFAKAAGRNFVQLRISDNVSGTVVCNFDLSTNVASASATVWTTPTGSIVDVGNGWKRLTVSGVRNNTGTTVGMNIFLASALNTTTYNGDGYSGIYIWGAQLEAGAFPTSYIPTVAAQVTRNADAASMTGTNFSSWYRQGEGTFYVESRSDGLGSSGSAAASLMVGDGGSQNLMTCGQFVASATLRYGLSVVAGVTEAVPSISGVTFPSSYYKTTWAYRVNDFAGNINGTNAATDTSGRVPVVDRMSIGSGTAAGTTQHQNGHIRKVAYYPARLTNAQLQAITS